MAGPGDVDRAMTVTGIHTHLNTALGGLQGISDKQLRDISRSRRRPQLGPGPVAGVHLLGPLLLGG
jgi:hypothetical protein